VDVDLSEKRVRRYFPNDPGNVVDIS